jgi:hypothetical protein
MHSARNVQKAQVGISLQRRRLHRWRALSDAVYIESNQDTFASKAAPSGLIALSRYVRN